MGKKRRKDDESEGLGSLRYETKTDLMGQYAYRLFPDGREVCLNTGAGRAEYKRRRLEMWYRDDGVCCICNKKVGRAEATFEHTEGRGMAASKRDDRIEYTNKQGEIIKNGVAHCRCNILRGSQKNYAKQTAQNHMNQQVETVIDQPNGNPDPEIAQAIT